MGKNVQTNYRGITGKRIRCVVLRPFFWENGPGGSKIVRELEADAIPLKWASGVSVSQCDGSWQSILVQWVALAGELLHDVIRDHRDSRTSIDQDGYLARLAGILVVNEYARQPYAIFYAAGELYLIGLRSHFSKEMGKGRLRLTDLKNVNRRSTKLLMTSLLCLHGRLERS